MVLELFLKSTRKLVKQKLTKICPNSAPLSGDQDSMKSYSIIVAGIVFAAQPVQAAPRSIAEITEIDQLGYECIDPKYLDEADDGPAAIAFTLTGKVRMPRTCLPEPCARALSQLELSQLTGTEMILPVFQKQWDDYYVRYADHCRKEVVPFGEEPLDPPMSTQDFWPPIVSPPIIIDNKISSFKTPSLGVQTGIPNIAPIGLPKLTQLFNPPNLGPAADSGSPDRSRCEAPVDGNEMWLYGSSSSGSVCRAGGGTAAGASAGYSPPPTTTPANHFCGRTIRRS